MREQWQFGGALVPLHIYMSPATTGYAAAAAAATGRHVIFYSLCVKEAELNRA